MKYEPKYITLDFQGTPLQTYIDRDGERWWIFRQFTTLLGFPEKEALSIVRGNRGFDTQPPIDNGMFSDSKEGAGGVREAGAFRLATAAKESAFHTWLCKNQLKPVPLDSVPPLVQELCKMLGTRELEYGPADLMFSEIAERWSATFKRPVTSKQVALCTIDLKMARLSRNVDHKDSLLDLIGYALCYARLKGWTD